MIIKNLLLMKNFTLLLLAFALCASTGYADNRKAVKAKRPMNVEMAQKNQTVLRQVLNFKPSVKIATPSLYATGENDYAVWEDFSKFTAGSEEAPDATDLGDVTTGEIDASYTLQPGWIGGGVYQAGGMAYIGMWYDETGFINTPQADLTANGATFKLSFRAKSQLAGGDILEVLHMYPGDSYAVDYQSLDLTTEWQDFSVTFTKGAEDSYIQMWTESGEWFLDDLKIDFATIQAPTNLTVTQYKGTSAVLGWDPVENAESYLLNVYSFNIDTYEYEYVLLDEPVQGTSYEVTGLDPTETYFFDVRAVVEGEESPVSEAATIVSDIPAPEVLPATNFAETSFTANWKPVEGASDYLLNVYYEQADETGWSTVYVYVIENEVVQGTSYDVTGLEAGYSYYYNVQARMADGTLSAQSSSMAAVPTLTAPEAYEATDVTSNSFTASWSAVDFGQIYLPYLYKEHKALADETYTFADADLSGTESTGTLESPELTYQQYTFDTTSGAYGWYISMVAFMDGAVGLDNSFASFFGMSFMYSPEMDLTHDGGKVTLELTYASADATTLVASLATVNEDSYLVEIQPVELPVTTEMTTKTVTLEGGTEHCYILVYALDGTSLMFQNLKATVNLDKDEVLETQADGQVVYDTKYTFGNLSAAEGERYAYDVVAVYYGDGYNTVYSDVSNKVYVTLDSGVRAEKADMRNAYVDNGVLRVANPYGEEVTVYNAAGMRISSDKSGNTSIEQQLGQSGVYLVRIGTKVVKVVK